MAHAARVSGIRGWRASTRFGLWFERMVARPEPVEVVEQRYNFLPLRFRWSGSLWRVRRVTQVWDEAATGLLPPRRYFQVLCDDGGERMLFQDLRLGLWYLRV